MASCLLATQGLAVGGIPSGQRDSLLGRVGRSDGSALPLFKSLAASSDELVRRDGPCDEIVTGEGEWARLRRVRVLSGWERP